MKINFAVLPAVVVEIIGIPQVRVVWIGKIAESVFFILVGLGLFGAHFFPFPDFDNGTPKSRIWEKRSD